MHNKHIRSGLRISMLALLVALLAACTMGITPGTNQGQSLTSPTATTPVMSTATTTATAPAIHTTATTATPRPSATKTPQKTATATPKPSGYVISTAAAQAVFQLINQERASQGLSALKWSTGLVRSAHLHNLWMLRDNKLSHQLSGEAGLFPRINAQGVSGSMVAENIGYGWGNAVRAAAGLNTSMFAETPPDNGHRLNILSTATIVGIDVIVNTHNSQVWLTEDFAQTA
ncbi:MAG TPA: CAP domain-containing protein [Ktedonobacteraceae bacterium]